MSGKKKIKISQRKSIEEKDTQKRVNMERGEVDTKSKIHKGLAIARAYISSSPLLPEVDDELYLPNQILHL